MSKISAYPSDSSVTTSDYLLGNAASGPTTKKFSIANVVNSNLLTVPAKFRCALFAAGNTGNNAYATIAFDHVIFDSGSNLSAGVFTVGVTGFYNFSWNVTATTTGATQQVIGGLFKNGTLTAQGSRSLSPGAATLSSTGSTIESFTAGDTVSIGAYGSATFAMIVGNIYDTWFSGFMVAAF